MLLEMDDGTLVPLAAVGKLVPTRADEWMACDLRGESLGCTNGAWIKRAQREAAPVLPAQPGWLLVRHAETSDPEFWHEVEPVIAWRIDEFPIPLTATGWILSLSAAPSEELEPEDWPAFLVAPVDGRLPHQAFGWSRNHATLEDGLRYAEEEWRKARASREKTA